MGKQKGPRFEESMEFERWKKLLKSWIRSLPNTTTHDEVVSAVVMGLSDSTSKSDALDLVLDIADDELYPVIPPPADGSDPPPPPPIDRSNLNSIAGLKLIIDTFEENMANQKNSELFRHMKTLKT